MDKGGRGEGETTHFAAGVPYLCLPREVHDDDRNVVERAGIQGLLHQTLGCIGGVDSTLAQTLNKVHCILVCDLSDGQQ